MKPIPSFRAAHLLPYIGFLKKIGAPVERGLHKARLPTMLTERPNAYLPQLPTIAFLTEISKSQGIDELGLRAVQDRRMTDFSEDFVAALCQSPTLQAALESFQKLAFLEDPYLYFWIVSEGSTAKLCSLYGFPLDPQDLRYEDWSQILALLAIVRAFAGPTWHPQEIAFRSDFPLSQFALEQFPNTRFLIGQDAAWITMPRDLCSLPLRAKLGAAVSEYLPSSEQPSIAEPTWDLPTSLRRVLASYLGDGYPPVELAADIAGISVRTLQRRLLQSNTNYSEQVQQARFEVASKLLRNTDAKMIDITYEVGYEDPSHFTRAFRRLAGLCPREYRRQYRFQ